MSGPFLIAVLGGNLGGGEVNRLTINGFAGIAAIYPTAHDDEYAPALYVGGRLGMREVVCEPRRTPDDKPCAPADVRPPCTRTK